ncbi:hypothetical protein GZH53_03705, partial [Flavihumibacter sp. R14]|nr:hypothetical protein [Flavihumibacter soli]
MKITFRSMPVKAMLLLFSFLLTAAISNAQCVLSKGDIVFTGYDLIDDQVNGTSAGNGRDDRFSFVILRDISANTQIFFTDLGWTSQGSFQSSDRARTDGVISWTANVAYPAGTEVTINTKFLLSASVGSVTGVLENYETRVDLPGLTSEYMSLAEISGDQIFAFTGNYLSNPTLLAAMSVNAPWASNLEYYETSSGTSVLPGTLASGAQNLSISRIDPDDSDMRDAYTARLRSLGTISGTAASIVSTVNNPANWELSPAATPYLEFTNLTNGNTFDLSLPVITAQPVNATNVCPTGSTFFEVTADATACSFQWQIYNTSTLTWDNLTNNGIYTTATTSKLNISNVSGLDGKRYRVRVYGTKPVLSSEVSISILPALSITTVSLPDAAKFVTYNQQLNHTGGKAAYTYTLNAGSTLPNGMTLSSGGILGGAPTVSGTASFTVKVTDGCGTIATKGFSLIITPEPLVTSVAAPSNGTYKAGDNLDFLVTYDASVNVTDIPALGLTVGSTARNAAYISGTASSSLTFRYTIQAADIDLDGIAITGIVLNGGTIKSAGGTAAVNSLAGVASTAAVLVDGVLPVVSAVSSSAANGSFNASTIIPVTITFSENVTVTGTPQLTLETGATDQVINYVSGSGTSTLTFNYTVQAGDNTSDLDYTSSAALALSGATIKDAAGNDAVLTLAAPGAAGSLGANKALLIDTQLPVVSAVSASTANGTYKSGDVITITLSLSEAVAVTGTPALSLNSAGTALYASGSGSSTLNFTYTIATGHSSADLDFSGTSALSLNSGTMRDAAGNNLNTILPAPGSGNSIGGQKNIVVDAIAPSILSAAVPADGTYGAGLNLDLTVSYNEAVTVNTGGGTPYIVLSLNTGGAVMAAYVSGSGTADLVFRYTLASGNVDNDGITLASSIALNGGTIRDAAGNNAAVSGISFGSTSSVLVDGIAPSVSSINRTAAALSNSSSLTYTLTFSEAVSGLDVTDLSLTSTGTVSGTIASVSLVSAGVYTVTVNAITGNGTLRLDVNASGTGITDAGGNPLGAGFTAGQVYTMDRTVPALTAVSIASNNSNTLYARTGDLITLSFTASETIQTPVVTIAGQTVTAVNTSGNSWTAQLTAPAGDGLITYSIAFTDNAGNAGIPVTTGSGSVTLDNTAPAAAANLAAAAGNTQNSLSWNANTDADLASYTLYHGTTSSPATLLTNIAAGSATTYAHTGLTNGTEYFYAVRATDKAGNSTLSTAVSAVPQAGQTLTFNAISSKTYGDASFTLGPLTSSAGLTVTYTAADASVVTISGNSATILKAGSTTITASQPGNTAVQAAVSVPQTLSVSRKDLVIVNTDRSKTYGDVLTNADFAGSITGIQNSDNITLTRSSTGSAAGATTATTYPIAATLADPDNKLANY